MEDPPAPTNPPVSPGQIGTFTLLWEDNFDTFDNTRWRLQTHSWDTNLAQFSTVNTLFAGGSVSILLTPEPNDTVKPFRGVEMRSIDTLTYGRIESRAKLAGGSGVVSALVLIYTPFPADDWNELDIEFLGRYTDRVQFNSLVYTGPPVQPPVTTSVTPTQFPEFAMLGFDPAADFHTYVIEWTPQDARFIVDGEVLRIWSTEIARLRLPQNILLTIWASSAADWAGPIDLGTSASAEYDWIRVYQWAP